MFHGDFNAILKVGKEEISMKHGYGVRQGDNLSPTLLIIVMQLLVEDVIKRTKIKYAPMSIIKTQLEEGLMTKLYSREELKKMKDKELNILAYFDDGSFSLNSRMYLTVGSETTCEATSKWGLTAHAGHDDKN